MKPAFPYGSDKLNLVGKLIVKSDINKDLLEKFTAEYLSKQIFFVCEKRVSLTDDTKAILEAIEEINIRSMEDDATLRGKKLLDYFKSEGIRIKIPCLLAMGKKPSTRMPECSVR